VCWLEAGGGTAAEHCPGAEWKRRGELIGASVCAAVARRGSRGALSGRGT
jgi:hypothetical protein